MTTSIEMAKALTEYAKDPNCFARDWISDASFNHWSPEEKSAFIEAGTVIKRLFNAAKK